MNDYNDNRHHFSDEDFNEKHSEYADIFSDSTRSEKNEYGYQKQDEFDREDHYHFSNNPPEKNLNEIRTDINEDRRRQKRNSDRQNGSSQNTGFKKFIVLTFMALFLGVAAGLGFLATKAVGDSLLGSKDVSSSVDQSRISDKSSESKNSVSESQGQSNINKVQGYQVLNDVSEIVKKNKPSMVNISATTKTVLQDFFRGSYYQEIPVSGSGFIISQDDEHYYIATNHHVIDNGENLSVAFIDNSVAPAVVKGKDAYNDLAVISINKKDVSLETQNKIKVVEIGDSENLVEGQAVIAMGNALGYGQSTTVGVISALDRTIQTEDGMVMEHLIQTDAAINFGNSGGALIDSAGRVIGINSAKNGGISVEGIGYAIPISKAEPIISNILSDDRKIVAEEKRGMLGVVGINSGEEAKERYGIPVGFYINEVTKGGGAEKSGIIKGDVIVAISGFKVLTQRDIAERLQFFEVGESVEVTLMRQIDGEYKEIKKDVVVSPKDERMLKEELFEKNRIPSEVPQDQENNHDFSNGPEYLEDEEFRNKLDSLFQEMFGRP